MIKVYIPAVFLILGLAFNINQNHPLDINVDSQQLNAIDWPFAIC